MRSHIESASLTLRPNGSGAAVGDAVVVVASKSARADIMWCSLDLRQLRLFAYFFISIDTTLLPNRRIIPFRTIRAQQWCK